MVGKEFGPYRILQKIAQGTMCAVYKGLHMDLEQDVAIKVLLPEFYDDRNTRERFIKEAKIQAGLSHPNIVRTLNFIETDRAVMMIMEYVNGETLDVLLRKARVLPPQRALAILQSVLDALDYMHSKGIVHRDLKPANIMVSYEGFVKVMDFGIAKMQSDNSRTKTGVRIGTLWYMSPEQIKGEQATALSDIYSIGVTMYQMVTGIVPFDGDTEFEIMKGHIEKAVVPPWKINKELDVTLGEVIIKAVAKNPKERFQSVKELLTNVKSAVTTVETTKIVTDSLYVRQFKRVWFHKPPAISWKALSAAALLLTASAAFGSYYLFSDRTGQIVSGQSGPAQSSQALKQPAPVMNDQYRSPAKAAVTPVEPAAPDQTRQIEEKNPVQTAHVSKSEKSPGHAAKKTSKRSVRKGTRSGVKQYAGYSANRNRSQQPVRTSTSLEQKPASDNSWSIRK